MLCRGRLIFLASVASLPISIAAAAHRDAADRSPIYGVRLPPGYRDWKVIGVAHEKGDLNSIRVILGNRTAIQAFRRGQRPFPNGAVIARVAWKYVASPRNNAIFGQEQSFVTGDPTNVQVSVKDTAKYPGTGGWGYGQFIAGKANLDLNTLRTCYACHNQLPSSEDRVFTAYAP